MKLSKKFFFPLAAFAVLGACAPYPPLFPYDNQQAEAKPTPEEQQTILDVKKKEEAAKLAAAKKKAADKIAAEKPTYTPPQAPAAPVKKYYPTAAKVPGKEGFVFNPYTQSLVNVKGIASGKLVRDPEDADTTHKFRVP